ncbi:MAG: class I SAM-dependent methyltransferase [Paracoccaceae bacterium]
MKTNALTTDAGLSPAEQWNRAAAGWNAHSAAIRQWLRKSTDAMISMADVSDGMRVLDVAAGAGDQTMDLAARVGSGGTVLATDISPAILAFAEENAAKAGFRTVGTLVADAEGLPLEDAAFDAAICRLGLMLLPRPEQSLREIHRVLKPGARLSTLVFSTIESNPCLSILMSTACRHAGVAPPDPYLPGRLTSLGKPGLLADMFGRAGFRNIVTARIDAPFRLPSARHYVEFVRDSGAPVVQIMARLSPEARQDAWVEIEETLSQFAAGDGWAGPNELLLATGST